MNKSAAVAVALVLGLAGWANAQSVTVTFSGIGGTNLNPIADVPDAGNYGLNYSTNALFWNNTGGNEYYAVGQSIVDTSYSSGFAGTWSVVITAEPGFEVLFDGYRIVRPTSGQPADDNTTVIVDGASNDKSTATVFTSGVQTVTFPTNRTVGQSITLSFVDGTDPALGGNGGDFAFDQYSFTVQAVPEPTVLAPMALAGMGMFLRRRRA